MDRWTDGQMVDTSPYEDATLRLRIAKGDATRTLQVVNGEYSDR